MTETPGEEFPFRVQAPDRAPWGLSWALLMPVFHLMAQVVMLLIIGAFVRAVLILMDPTLVNEPEVLQRGILVVTIFPVALGSSLLTIGLIYGSVTLVHGRSFFESLGLVRTAPSVLGQSALMGAATAVVSIALASAFPPDPEDLPGGPLTELAGSGPLGHLSWLVMAVFLAPVVEEILFRGYAFLGSRRRLGPLGAGAWVTGFFVILHVAETGDYWPALAGISVMASLLIITMHRTGNLTRCIAIHAGYNAVLAVLTFLPAGAGT